MVDVDKPSGNFDIAAAQLRTIEVRQGEARPNGRVHALISIRGPDGNLITFSPVLFDDGSGEYIGRKSLNLHPVVMAEIERELREQLGVPLPGRAAPATQRRIVRAGDSPLAAPDYQIDGILARNSLAALVAKEASYKSFVAVGLAAATFTGREWAGHPSERGAVLYLAAEGAGGMRRRLRAWEIVNGASLDDLLLLPSPVNFVNDADVAELEREVDALPDPPALIVVDTLARNFGGNENAAEDMGRFVAACDRLRALNGACVLIVHHENKIGGYRGSTAFAGAMDTMIEAKRDGSAVTLTCTKQKDDTEFAPIHLASRVVELGFADRQGREVTSIVLMPTSATFVQRQRQAAVSNRALTSNERAALDALNAAPGRKLTYSEWLKESRLPRNTFDRIRLLFIDEGRVAKIDNSGYQVTPKSPPIDPHGGLPPPPYQLTDMGVGVNPNPEEDDDDDPFFA